MHVNFLEKIRLHVERRVEIMPDSLIKYTGFLSNIY